MKLVCISDTHLQHNFTVPDGDVLIHAGDATGVGNKVEIVEFAQWFGLLPHRHKIFVAGNHDFGFQTHRAEAAALLPLGCHYLQDSGCEIGGVRFWGSPWQPMFLDWAFNLPRLALREKWNLIPTGTDVLITHGPPHGIGDGVARGEHIGCQELLEVVGLIAPRLHIFGHNHGGYGRYLLGPTQCINASICDESYAPMNAPVVVEIE